MAIPALGRLRRRWPQLRLAFIAVHLCAVTIAALPTTAGLTQRAQWTSPAAQAEFAAWAKRLSALGIATDADTLRERAWGVATSWARTHAALRRPFVPYYACCGTDQTWRLFAAPDRFPSRLGIDVRIDGDWLPVYRELSGTYDWRIATLRSHRVRGISHLFADTGDRQRLGQLASWLGQLAARDFEEATAIRLRYVRGPLPTSGQLVRGELPSLQPVTEIVQVIE